MTEYTFWLKQGVYKQALVHNIKVLLDHRRWAQSSYEFKDCLLVALSMGQGRLHSASISSLISTTIVNIKLLKNEGYSFFERALLGLCASFTSFNTPFKISAWVYKKCYF